MSGLTPIGSRLQISLDAERLRMANEWFFKWHHIGGEAVSIDGFDGRNIRYGGIKFSGTARRVYWDTIQRYARQKVGNLFDELESELQRYPIAVRPQALREALSLIRIFIAGIRREAVKTDRILRGDGSTFPPEQDLGTWSGARSEDIAARIETLRSIYCVMAVKGDQPVFDDLMNDRIALVKADGTLVKEDIVSLVGSGSIQLNDVSLVMERGDHLLRKLPNGLVEDYEIIDPQFHSGFSGMESFWTVKVRRSGAPTEPTGLTVQRITNNFHGANSRVNIHSTDQSTNLWQSSASVAEIGAFLHQVRSAASGLPAEQRSEIDAPLALLEDEIQRESPSPTRLRSALESIRNVAEQASGNLVAAGIVSLASSILSGALG